jgi:hypothetical protein
MAQFCIATGQTPEVYRSLTLQEYRAFIEAFEERFR